MSVKKPAVLFAVLLVTSVITLTACTQYSIEEIEQDTTSNPQPTIPSVPTPDFVINSKVSVLNTEVEVSSEAIFIAIKALEKGDTIWITQGTIIGIQGNTGKLSTGEHLHFQAHYNYRELISLINKGGWLWYELNTIDPTHLLAPLGPWVWPVENAVITQGYHSTHRALDLVGSRGAPVKAVADGHAFFCNNCLLGNYGKSVFLFHDDGYMTFYLHLDKLAYE